MSFSKPKAPKESPDAAVLRERQVSDLVKLDDEENVKVKRLLNGARGIRAFAGSALTRAAPSNSAGRMAVSRGSGGGGGGGGAGSYGGYGGYRGGLARGGGILP